jgi:hypothetical protein
VVGYHTKNPIATAAQPISGNTHIVSSRSFT